jgi:transcriptional regulator with XRE-family HTH domain
MISAIERGERFPSKSTMDSLADALGITTRRIFNALTSEQAV